MTYEQQDAVMAEINRELEREAYDAVAGADLGPCRDDLDEYCADPEPYSAVAGSAGEEGFLL